MSQSHVDNGSQIIYHWTIVSGQTVYCPGSYEVGGYFRLLGTNQPNGTDSYSVTTVSSVGTVITSSGTF